MDPEFDSIPLGQDAKISGPRAHPSQSFFSGLMTKQMNVQKMLMDEKRKTEQCKSYYLTLKSEYNRLQDNFSTLQKEMTKVLEENKNLNENSVKTVDKAHKIIEQQQKEIEELQTKIINQGSEKVFLKLKETENNLKAWVKKLEAELDHYRKEYSKLHFQSATLKSQLGYSEVENKRIVEALKLQHETEITNLQNKVDELLQEKSNHDQQSGQYVRTLQRENSKLHMKVKGLLTDLEELRNKREKTGLQADNVVRLQTRQLAEHAITTRALESDLKSCQMQKEQFEKELTASYETNKTLSSQLQSAKMEIIHVKNQFEKSEQKFQVELASLKIDNLRTNEKVESERNQLAIEVANLKLDVEASKEQLESAKHSTARKEAEWQRQIYAIQYKSWEQCQKIEMEKKEVEEALKKNKKYNDETRTELQQSLKKVERDLLKANKDKSIIENEILSQREELNVAKQELASLEELKIENATLQKEITKLKQEKSDFQHLVEECQQHLHREKQVSVTLNHELQTIKMSSNQREREESQAFLQQRVNVEKERERFNQRIEELEKKLSETNMKMNTDIQILKQKKQQYAHLISKLRNKIQILDAKLAEVEIENEILRKNVPIEVHIEVKKELSSLKRQYEMMIAVNQTKMSEMQQEGAEYQ